MSKNRYVDTEIWDDDYINLQLDPTEKLLFVILITNKETNIAGAYKITLSRLVALSGLDKDIIKMILTRFERDRKACYADGYILLKNTIKRQLLKGNPKITRGIIKVLQALPEEIKRAAREKLDLDYDKLAKALEFAETLAYDVKAIAYDSLSIGYDSLYIALDSLRYNLNSNLNLNSNNKESIIGGEEKKISGEKESANQKGKNIDSAKAESPSSSSQKPSDKKEKDFIDKILDVWCEEFKESRGIEYEIDRGKDRSAAGKMLAGYKKKQKAKNNGPPSEEKTLADLRAYFRDAMKVDKKEFFENITFSKLYSYRNEYNQEIKKIKEKSGTGKRTAVNSI